MTRNHLPKGLLRRALMTEDFSDLTPAEIAEVLGTSANSVQSDNWWIHSGKGTHTDASKAISEGIEAA